MLGVFHPSMSSIIAFAGKGGTGKTTVCALTLRALVTSGRTPVLAVDADPNACLGEAFGVRGAQSIGQMREKFIGERQDIPPGMTKEAVFQMLMNQIIVENEGWDLLVMGRPEGPGCYCYVNNVLRRFLETLAGGYRYALIDHEAGMEHLSRHNTGRADALLYVAEPTVTSLRAVRRLDLLVDELGLSIGKRGIVLNRVGAEPGEHEALVREELGPGLGVIASIPFDEALTKADLDGIPLMQLDGRQPCVKAAEGILPFIG
jgi:CO dehydrogenase maturation factor